MPSLDISNWSIEMTYLGEAPLTDGNAPNSLLSMAGYFNAVPSGPIYELSIPNKEIADIFGSLLLESLYGGESGWVLDFCDAVLKNDLPRMQEDLFTMISVAFDAKVFSSEHTYQTLVTGMLLTLYDRYRITSDFRGGEGYYSTGTVLPHLWISIY